MAIRAETFLKVSLVMRQKSKTKKKLNIRHIFSARLKRESFKKAWAYFLLFSLVFSQGFSYSAQTPLAKAEDFTPQSLPVLVQTYEPSNSLTVSSVNTSLVWENPDRAYLTQLSKDSASAQFSSANSAVLKVIAASTTEVTVSVGQALPIVPDSGATSSVLSAGVFESSSTPENISALQPELNHGQAEAFQQASQTPAENLLVPSPAIETSDFEAVAPSVQVYAGDVETAEALPDAAGSADLQAVVSPVAENGKEASAQPVSDTEAQVGPSSEEVVPSSSPGVLDPVIGTTSPESLALPLETTSPASSTEVFIPLLDLFQEIPTASGSVVSNLTETPEPTTTPEDVFNTSSMPSLISPDLVSAPQLEYSGFNLALQDPDLSTSTQPTNLKLRLSLASLPIVSGSLVLEYAVATSSFQGLSVLNLSSGTSNYIHNGYVETALPLALYHDMSSFKIRMTYQAEREDLNQNPGQVILYLDGLSVVATYPDYSWDEEDLAALKLPPIAPEQFAHLEFFGPLMELFMPSDLSVNPITVGSRLDVNTVLPLKLLPWGVSTATPPTRLGETVTYSGAFASTDLEYKLTDTVLKENIILKDKAHPAKFRYLVNFDGYDPVQVSPSVIVLYQKGHKGNRLFKRYTLSAPVMTDSQGQTSDKLVFRLKGNLLTLTPDAEFLKQAAYPVVVDPTVELNILNVSSFPVAGEYWTIDFTTLGQDNLLVTPGDQATIDDMQFSSLTCDGASIASELQANGAVFSPNWTCDGLGQIKFLDKKTGHHHMVFSFGPATQDAYNGANVYTGVTGGAWETGSNWSLGTPPGPADDVVINTAVTVNVNASSTVSSLTVGVSGGGTASVLNFNYNAVGAPVTTLGDLVVYSGASVTHTGNSTSTPLGRINFSVGGNATVSGSITANGKGFDATKGPGAARLNSSAGGSYGGLGGPYGSCCAPADYTAATVTYGSITQPTDLGSGGGSSGSGDGGGAVQLAVTGTTTVTGSITANGADSGCCTGAGSGGSIYLTTSVLAGGGNITANGGYGSWSGGSGSTGGSGGGGRIAIYYTSDTSTTTVQNHGNYVSFFGRSVGGAGTIYKKAAAQTYGDLIVDNDNIQGATTDESLLAPPTPISGTYDSITARDNAVFHLSTTTASATTVTIATNALYDVRAGTTLSYSTLTWGGGMLMDSGGTLAVLNQNQDLTIPSGSKLIQAIPSSSTSTLRTYNNVSVQGTLTHAYNAYATTGSPSLFRINWTINGDLSVTGTGTITALGRGYVSQQGPGVGTLSSGAGGSYGGYGSPYGSCCASADYTTQGPTYGSSTAPTDLGSGGASSGSGVGGGAIILNVTGTTTVSTSISADGAASGCCTGGGSGGSVYLTTAVLAGTGTISANGGGSGCSGASGSCGGTGGGGRVAVHYTTDASTIVYANHGNYASFFGRSIGGAGTIYKKNPSQTYGDLILDNDNMQGVTSDETLFGSSTPVSGVYDSITVRDTAAFFTNALSATATTITLSGNGMYDVRQNTTLNYTSLSWGGGIIMDSGGTFAVISQNQDLLIPTSSKLTLNVPGVTRTYNNLTINGLLSNSRNYFATSTTPTSSIYKLNWTINGNLVINSAGSINVDGRGYAGTYGPGAGSTYTASCCGGGGGAGYGGLGGSAGAAGGVTYGSYSQPTDLGSGGGSSGGTLGNAPGGGAIQMTVSGTTTLSGTISANGSAPLSGNDNGGGSGGSVYLTTAALSGAGAISTDGAGPHRYGASGAGGRIAVYYTTDNSTATYSNHGGGTIYGGAGTTYKKSTIQTYGDLIVDNNNLGSSDETVFGRTPLASVALDSLTIRNSGSVYLSAAQATATTLTLSGNGHYDVKSGTELTYSSLVWTGGILTDSDGVLQVLNQNQDLTIPTSSKLVFNVPGSTRTYNNFVISGILTHSRNTMATTGTPSLLLYKLDWQVNGNLTINTNGSINVDGRGYENAGGPGAGVTYTLSCCGGGGGGGYGGIGASAGAAGGSFYGSLTAPTDLGSAGGSSGGTLGNAPGGGAVIFNVTGTSTLNGSISSKGVIRLYGNDDGGGSGGSVYLTTAGLSGSGTIYADGGPTDRYGGAGAGGRIALYYTADNSTLSYSNHGSNVGGNGGAGTTYRKGSAQTYGDLILDNNNYGGTTVANFGKTQVNTPLAFDNLTLKNSAFLHAVSAVVYSIVGGLTWSNAAGTSTYVTLQLAPSSSVATITQTGTMPINLPLVVDGVGTTSLATALSASSTLTVAAGVFYANNNTSTYSGLATISGGTYSASALPQNFLAGLTQTSGAFVGGSGTVNITGNLNLSGGNFNPSGTTNITGNLNNSGGTFLATSGTVALTGLGQTVSGDNTFYNLTKTVAV
ncbi:MAG: hypothetical protein M1333_03280, partial [Patescibacteria group bacterium]|nr:hypothetical protein [Patescibacteria group bacterium]